MSARRPITVLVPAKGLPTTADRAAARTAMLKRAADDGYTDIARLLFAGTETHDGIECHRFEAVAS